MVKALTVVLLVQLAIGGTVIALAATGELDSIAGGGSGERPASLAAADRFDGRHAFASLRSQVKLGPRPAGSPTLRRLGERIRAAIPGGHFQELDGGLRNVIGEIPGRDRGRTVIVGAHYDTKDLPGFVGANDGASGAAVALELARTIKPHTLGPNLVLLFFDGEESPAGAPDDEFLEKGLRGSRAAAPNYRGAEAMILLDFVGDRDLRMPREALSDPALWGKLRAAARRVGAERAFPEETTGGIDDDHLPFEEQAIPSIDLIDFDYACFHRRCDDLRHVSQASVDSVGETVLDLLRTL